MNDDMEIGIAEDWIPNLLTGEIITAAIKVHRVLGPGLLEGAYRICLTHELRKRRLSVMTEVPVPVTYDGVTIDIGYRMDLLVQQTVIVELKAVTKLHPVHEAQLLSHLKLSGLELGLLINFHSPLLKDGIKRFINR